MSSPNNISDTPIKTTSSKIIFQNAWIKIHEDQTIMPSGKPGVYAFLESRDSVMTALLDERQRLLMIRSFRYPSKSWGWELAGGGSDEGEDVAAAALREVEEETGIRVGAHEQIGKALVCNGLMTESTNVFVGYDLSYDGNKNIGDEALGDMRFFTVEEVGTLIDTGEINDGQTITALFYLTRWLQKKGH